MADITGSARTSHPRFRRLLDVADGLLDDPRVRAAKEHVDAGCVRGGAELESIMSLCTSLAAGPLERPPRAALRRASRLFATQRLAAGVAAVRRVRATLVLDQHLASVPALRSSGDGRRLLWTIGDMELFATLVGDRRGATLRGQFLPSDADAPVPSGDIRVLRDGRVSARAKLDGDGEFSAHQLRAGTYVIEGEVGDVVFASPPFVVGA